MYCIQCGVRLADTEKACPLCGLRVYHPDLPQPDAAPAYPADTCPPPWKHSFLPHLAIAIACLIPCLVVLLADLRFGSGLSWSGYVIGGILVGYVALLLPRWFRKPNPVIFTPCALAAALIFLLYIDLMTPGSWFLTLALPVGGCFGLIVTTVVTLTHYLKKGWLYIFGGGLLALGGLCVLTEWMIQVTFHVASFAGWSLFPMIPLAILGLMLIILAICGGARQALHRKFFI